MALRRFVDATGTKWEVFHVRWKATDSAVATALGAGWLSFVSATEKRRSQVVPAGWAGLPDAELERLCAAADVVRSVRMTGSPDRETELDVKQSVETRTSSDDQQSRRARGPRLAARSAPLGEIADVPATAVAPTEEVVRTLARSAREQRVPVLDAVVQLKRELDNRGESTTKDALKVARRWFIDSFYFGRGA